MNYEEVEKNLLNAVDAANHDALLACGLMLLADLTDPIDLDSAPSQEMSPEAWDALHAAVAGISTQSAKQLREYLERIDDGVLSDGDMDHDLLTALESLQAWQRWLATENPEAIADLAVLRLSQIDFEVDACLEDFLAPREMAEAFQRIVTALGS